MGAAAHFLKGRPLLLIFTMVALSGVFATVISVTVVYGSRHSGSSVSRIRQGGWRADGFKSLVTFGDSYTDETRLGYFLSHNNTAPPIGWVQPIVSSKLSLLMLAFSWEFLAIRNIFYGQN